MGTLKTTHFWGHRTPLLANLSSRNPCHLAEASLDCMTPYPPSFPHWGSHMAHTLSSLPAFSGSLPNRFLTDIFLNKILACFSITLSLCLPLRGSGLTQIVPRGVWANRQQDRAQNEFTYVLAGREHMCGPWHKMQLNC